MNIPPWAGKGSEAWVGFNIAAYCTSCGIGASAPHLETGGYQGQAFYHCGSCNAEHKINRAYYLCKPCRFDKKCSEHLTFHNKVPKTITEANPTILATKPWWETEWGK